MTTQATEKESEQAMSKTPTATQIVKAEDTPMSLMQMAIDKGADVQQLEKLMDLQERWERNQSSKAFGDALAAFQNECPQIHKGRKANAFGGGQGYSFAGLDDIMRQIQPVLSKHSLSVNFSTSVNDKGAVDVVCRIRCGTHVEATDMTIPIPDNMKVNATQKMGAALSYAKRYALCAALNISVTDEDNDAARLNTKTITEEQAIQLKEIAEPLDGPAIQACMRWLGVQAWDEVPAKRFDEVKRAVLAKVAQQKKGGGK